MHRKSLLDKLQRHRGFDETEERGRRRIIEFVRANAACFDRAHSPGHITGSAWVLDPSGDRVLLTFHKKLNMWLQLGGHADSDPDILAVAIREAQEESGIAAIKPITEEVFDVDVHPIPAHGHDPPHDHHDVRFLLRAETDRYTVSEESHELGWFTREQLARLPVDASVQRMHRKWLAML